MLILFPFIRQSLLTLTSEEDNYGYARRALRGHNHFVSDVVISSDGQFGLSGSWDGTLLLWEISTDSSATPRKSCPLPSLPDNRQIVSGSPDRTVKLWNTLGECKYTIVEDGHTSGFPASDSLPRPMPQSLCPPDGTRLSRSRV